jgi:hypothetical protein
MFRILVIDPDAGEKEDNDDDEDDPGKEVLERQLPIGYSDTKPS